MAQVRETQLPGVGVRHDFETTGGDRIGVLTHKTGWRELLFYDRADPDACTTVRLEEDDSRALADLLGATQVAEQLSVMQQQVSGLAIDWLTIPHGSPFAGGTLAESELRKRHGVTVVAVARAGQEIPVPSPDFRLEGGDVAIVLGSHDDVAAFRTLLEA